MNIDNPYMHNSKMGKGLSSVLLLIVLFFSAFVMYKSSIPKTYNLVQGMVSNVEIDLSRPVINKQKTEEKAMKASSAVPDTYRWSKKVADTNIKNIKEFVSIVSDVRQEQLNTLEQQKEKNIEESDNQAASAKAEADMLWKLSPEDITKDVASVKKGFSRLSYLLPADSVISQLIEMRPSVYEALSGHIVSIASVVTNENLTTENISGVISKRVEALVSANKDYSASYQLAGTVLQNFITPNMIYDPEATEQARKDAYNAAMSSPVIIDKGTKIVAKGDVITSRQMDILRDADLISNGKTDWNIVGGIVITLILVSLLGNAYVQKKAKFFTNVTKTRVTIVMTLLLPFIITAYVSEFSQIAIPVYFASILLTAYYGVQIAIALSTGLALLLFPMSYFNYHFLFCAIIGILVSSLVTSGFTRRDKYAFVIVSTAISPALASVGLDLILKTGMTELGYNAVIFAATGAMSAIAAIGLMPLYEIFLDAVSPLRLIELSNPNNDLLKNMLVQAPGTSQHSMMVANLSEVAAEAIGANPLLTRVGALYHDIGKMKHPEYFTENQQGENPHDKLTPEQSVSIIFGHVTDGVIMARKHRLPEELISFITEHHGNTLLVSIYAKACKIAEEEGKPVPCRRDFIYPGSIPHSKETGIVMLADSVEAAMKSTGYKELDKAEELIRKVVKGKNDQDQLVGSGLSYKEVEQIIQSFLQVYSGQFHERIKYPDASTLPKS